MALDFCGRPPWIVYPSRDITCRPTRMLAPLAAGELHRSVATGDKMPTFGEKFIGVFDDGITALDALSRIAYTEAEIRNIVSGIGTATELFLKSVVLPNKPTRKGFEWFINELASVGVACRVIGALHDLRLFYNRAKHEPNTAIHLTEALETIKAAAGAATTLVATGVGRSDSQAPSSTRRVFWIAAWDHFLGGDTEISIFLPGNLVNGWAPPALDEILVEMQSWDQIKDRLNDVGVLRDGKHLVSPDVYDFLQQEGDFLACLVYEGDHRELITILASYEKVQDLLPGLNRADSQQAMALASITAALDSLPSATPDNLVHLIVQQAVGSYAVPEDYPYLTDFAKGLGAMFSAVPHDDWSQIHGPFWLSSETFASESETAVSRHPEWNVMITKDLAVAQLWGK